MQRIFRKATRGHKSNSQIKSFQGLSKHITRQFTQFPNNTNLLFEKVKRDVRAMEENKNFSNQWLSDYVDLLKKKSGFGRFKRKNRK